MKKTIIIYSGGLDSTVLLWFLRARGDQVRALSVDYGQRHATELFWAEQICQKHGIERQVANLSPLKSLLGGSSQTDDRVSVPHGHYTEESMKATVVPNRNMLMLAAAGAWAISTKSDLIAYAAHAGDHAIYPDCREEFVAPLNAALEHADWHKVSIDRPFLRMEKWQIVKLGVALGAPLSMTYSCYEGQPMEHCGKCGTCVERREAFQLAGVPDPTRYKAQETVATKSSEPYRPDATEIPDGEAD